MRAHVCVCVCGVVLEVTEQKWPTEEGGSSGRMGVSKQAFPWQRAAADAHSHPEGPNLQPASTSWPGAQGIHTPEPPRVCQACPRPESDGSLPLQMTVFVSEIIKIDHLTFPSHHPLLFPKVSKAGKLLALDEAHSEKCSAWPDSQGGTPKLGTGLAGEGGEG